MKIIKLNAIGSTNSYLKDLIHITELEDELVVVAVTQKKGRGQHGAIWQSETGKSLTCSLFKRFEGLAAQQQAMLTFVVSLAITEVLRAHGVPNVTIKWPNDIMSRQKKMAGILIENQIQGKQLSSAIIGIGLNVNETNFDILPQATSMRLATSNLFCLDDVLVQIAESVFEALNGMVTNKIPEVQKLYEAQLFRKDMVSVFERNGIRENGRILGVTSEGKLRVAYDNGEKQHNLKEVKLLF